MATKSSTKASKSEAADKVAAMHEEVTAGVAALVEDGRWKALLRMQARFHSYSLGNLLLIAAQCPTATQVAGFRTWQSLGRQVQGAHGVVVGGALASDDHPRSLRPRREPVHRIAAAVSRGRRRCRSAGRAGRARRRRPAGRGPAA